MKYFNLHINLKRKNGENKQRKRHDTKGNNVYKRPAWYIAIFFLERPVLLEKYCDCVDVLLIFTNY